MKIDKELQKKRMATSEHSQGPGKMWITSLVII